MFFNKRNIKEILRQVLREEIVQSPLIISHRAPTLLDNYEKGTTWVHGNESYISKKTETTWEKQ